ncbi:hypothetical protein C5167_044753 [Papaver somniferum]|uniref:GATA zinc finger domain-containing protein 7-like n=1 Tax=Papaver somniferum TaxID=3469 RepID=UPI000E705EA1|nr:GATA zinc finger domain-containing protein 7-like [Papaver somniferum]RZC90123.1 hypothetical protein C5167_044753 [Papaver somniferum]
MRSNTRSSTTKQGNNNKGGGTMEIEKLKKLKDEPHLSGAYIRNLVKQLTSSRKEPSLPNMNKQGQDVDHVDENEQNQGTTTNHSISSPKNQPQQQPQQPKKQVRRRLHTSRPYQERLLNMAEARREIVTALKFHRASMKQANEQQQQQQQSQSLHNPSSFEHEQQERSKYRRNPRIYPSNTTTTTNNNNNNNFTNYLENSSYSSFSCPTPCLMQPNMNHFLSSPCIEPTLPIIDHLNLTTLPNYQPLGLNLNFHDFNNLDTTSLYYNNNNSQFSSMYSYPSPSSSSSPPPTLASTSTTEETHSFVTSPEGVLPHSFPMTDMMIDATVEDNGLHPTMDDDEMAEIRSIGEQHGMEWNDTLNLVTSAWWFKYLKKMEINNNNSHDHNKGGLISSDEDGIMSSSNLFDEVMEFPSWMNANNTSDGDESFFLQQHLDDSYYSDNKDYFQESALPCMDIGEIDGMDNEWLA